MNANARVIQLQSEPTTLNIKDIDTLIEVIEKRVPAKEVMRIEDARNFLGISVRQINHMCQQEQLPFHRLPGLGGKLFLRSELIDHIKRH